MIFLSVIGHVVSVSALDRNCCRAQTRLLKTFNLDDWILMQILPLCVYFHRASIKCKNIKARLFSLINIDVKILNKTATNSTTLRKEHSMLVSLQCQPGQAMALRYSGKHSSRCFCEETL